MKFFDSKTNDYIEINKNKLNIYVCGPTVYNDIHIGNARPIIVFDVLIRLFKHLGIETNFIHNFTDIDDKIINRAIELKVKEQEVSDKYIHEYNLVLEHLNINKPNFQPKVTDVIPDIINFINKLIEKGFAYTTKDGVYFSVAKDTKYGEISKRKLDDALTGTRVEADDAKANTEDFVLWKLTDKGIAWESPWGNGRPGWHTECVVFISKYANGHVDIHGGGTDLKFPHHENENAQSNALTKKPLSDIWMHNGLININGEKMAKSLGNFILTKDAIKTYGADVIRFILLSSHYRHPVNFAEDILIQGKKELEKWENTLKKARFNLVVEDHKVSPANNKNLDSLVKVLSDDLNTPNAFSIINEMSTNINKEITNKNWNSVSQMYAAFEKAILDILGFKLPTFKKVSDEDIQKIHSWSKAVKIKNFIVADKLRKELINNGVI